VAIVEFPAFHFGFRFGHFHQLRVLQFAWSWLFIYSRPPVAVDFGCPWPCDSGSVLDIYVFDGVQQAGMVGVAIRCSVCIGRMVWLSHIARGITF
jgi:hypothetical protein